MFEQLCDRAARDLKLSDNALRVLDLVLAVCAERGMARLKASQIAEHLGFTERTVFRALKRLEEGKYVQRVATGRSGMIIAAAACE